MRIVLLSGGSGKRLWPLSNDTQSKQFLSLLPGSDGQPESMVQRVVRQIRSALPNAEIAISTNQAQTGSIRRQLGDIACILEPCRRDTFPAIVLAAAYIHYVQGGALEEPFITLPIDVFASDEYFASLTAVVELANSTNLALLGVRPTYASSKYGYIIPKVGDLSASEVNCFVEKPSEFEAAELIKKGALWNCGVFGCKLGYVLERAREYLNFSSYDDILKNYEKLPKTSFDYAVVEHESRIGVVAYEGNWKDLGTWNTLTEELGSASIGEDIIIDKSCKNTHILNMLNTPIIAMGLKDIVAVASHDGILISDKNQSSYLKPLAEQIDQRPFYEKREWGTYHVLDYEEAEQAVSSPNQSYLVKHIRLEPGKAFSLQYHEQRSEVWVIINGKGMAIVGGEEQAVAPGSVVSIGTGVKHKLIADTAIDFIEVQLGPSSLSEEDIIRLDV